MNQIKGYTGGVRNRRIRALARLKLNLVTKTNDFEEFLSLSSNDKWLEKNHLTKDSAANKLAIIGSDIDRINKEISILTSKI